MSGLPVAYQPPLEMGPLLDAYFHPPQPSNQQGMDVTTLQADILTTVKSSANFGPSEILDFTISV